MKINATFLVTVLWVAVAAWSVTGQTPRSEQQSKLPPVSYTCVMHPDVVEDKPGTCPLCKLSNMTMNLVPVRLETIYSCPIHAVVQEKNPGKCPICRRELIQLTMQMSFTCPDHPEIDKINPGRCPDGSAMERKYSARAHGNHNPRHNGQFFMAEDTWHHLEGAYPEEGLFRLYLYDDYTKPLPLDQAKQVTGRVVTKETFDAATKTATEISAYPLKLAENGQYLEAKVAAVQPSAAAPAQMSVKLKFKRDQPKEFRFDFAFPDFSQDKTAATLTALGIVETGPPLDIPDDARQVLQMLGERNKQLAGFVRERQFDQLWVPAFQAKDLALALDVRTRDLPAHRRAGATASIDRLVRSAWLLDQYGDTGDRAEIEQAYDSFSRAFSEIESTYSDLKK